MNSLTYALLAAAAAVMRHSSAQAGATVDSVVYTFVFWAAVILAVSNT